jgi:hypothetical protein
MQAALDTVLARASDDVRERFEQLLLDLTDTATDVTDEGDSPSRLGRGLRRTSAARRRSRCAGRGSGRRPHDARGAARVATRLGHDGNHRRTGFGPNNVRQHRVSVALALGDAGTAITLARQVQLDRISLAERKAALFVDVAQANAQWGRYDNSLSALRTAYRIAPEEIRHRPSVHRIITGLAVLSRGPVRGRVGDFAASAGIAL